MRGGNHVGSGGLAEVPVPVTLPDWAGWAGLIMGISVVDVVLYVLGDQELAAFSLLDGAPQGTWDRPVSGLVGLWCE